MALTRPLRLAAAVAAFSTVLAVSASTALATFPGANGKIAYTSEPTNDPQIWTINPDGSGEELVTQASEGAHRNGQWSADGSRFAFLKTSASLHADIWIRELDGQVHRPHDNTSQWIGRQWRDVESFSWTPDGDIILNRQNPRGHAVSAGFLDTFLLMSRGLIDASAASPGGTAMPDVLVHSPRMHNKLATVSPNAHSPRIAFVSERNGEFDLYTMKIDGTDVQQKSHISSTQEVVSISWSPDARQIAFTVMDHAYGAPEILAYSISSEGDGSDRRPLGPDGTQVSGFPVWSPDGTKIVLTVDRGDGTTAGRDVKLAVINSADRNEVRYLDTHPGASGRSNPVPVASDWQALPVPAAPAPASAPALVQPRAALPARPVVAPVASSPRKRTTPASVACRLAMVKISKAKFSAGQKVKFSFQLNKQASIVVSFRRHGSKTVVARKTAKGRRGKNEIKFTGRISTNGKTKALSPGRYIAEVVAKDARGKKSKPHRVTFVVTKR